MKFAKRTVSVLLAVLMLVSILPLSVYAASLKITTQPKTSYTEYGSTAKATVKASGDGLKYTWYIKNAGASKYSKSSVTKSTYSVKMTDSTKGRSVYCVVKDKKGKTVKSSTAILRMKATVTTEPKTTYAKEGATAKLTVKAKGDGLKYTWYIKNAGKTKYSKSSVTKSTYSVTMSDKVHGRYVYCVVTDKYGKTDKSKTVVLRQQATITTQPKTTSAALGETAKLTVKAKGDDLKYTWYIKNAGGSKYSKSSVTKSTYSVTMSEKVNGRYVYCVVTDKYGKTDKSKTVMLKLEATPLTITMQPEDITCKVGDEVGFGVVVKGGTAPYTYQWEYTVSALDGWQAVPEEAIYITGDIVSAVLPVVQSHFNLNFRIRCVITDAKGAQVTTNEAGLIQAFDELAITMQPQNVTAKVGDTVSFSVAVSGGKAPYTYQWEFTTDNLSEWLNVDAWAIGNTANLSFRVDGAHEWDNHYKYRCVITDAEGNEVISDEVWVEAAPLTIVTQPQNVTCKAGDKATFSVAVSGGTEPYAYQWQYMTNTFSWTDVAGWANGTDATLSFDVASSEFEYGYQYRCIITDADGNQVITEAAWVEAAPLTIVTQPQNIYAKVGDTVSFSVAVSGGTTPYTYQWEFNLDGFSEWRDVDSWATGNTDNTMSFQVEGAYEWNDHYKYRCVITDAAGNQIISDEAWVEEYVAPLTIVTQPWNVAAEIEDTVSFSVAVSGGKAPYTYQWQIHSVGNGDVWSNILDSGWASGEQTESLSFVVGQYEYGNYQYRCVITDAEGNEVITNAVWVIEG